MKKTVIRFLVLLIAALLSMLICINRQSGQLILTFEIPPEATEATVSFIPEGIVEVTELAYDFDADICTVSLKALNPGSATAVLKWDKVDSSGFYSQEMQSPLHVYRGGLLLDSITLNFSGWENLVLITEALSLLCSVLLFCEFLCRRAKSRLFSYETVRFLGFSIFFLVLGLVWLSSVISAAKASDFGTVWSVLIGLAASSQLFAVRTAPFVICFAIAVAISNVVLIRKEGFFFSNLFAFAIGALMALGSAVCLFLYYSRFFFPGINEIMNIFAGIFVYFECHLAATVLCSLLAGHHTPAYTKDYILILGCKVRPDGTLYPIIRSRVDRALQFADEQILATGKTVFFVPSGGKGSDEALSEADAMANYLIAQGIPRERILIENRSCNTWENMAFSKLLIGSQVPDDRIVFSTSSYHVFRSGILAGKQGWNIDGLGSKTKWYFWPNAFLREFVGMLADGWKTQLITLVLIAAISYAIMQII